jgi:PAS domain S-box-containing protein
MCRCCLPNPCTGGKMSDPLLAGSFHMLRCEGFESGFELRPDRVKSYDVTLRRLACESLRLVQYPGIKLTEYIKSKIEIPKSQIYKEVIPMKTRRDIFDIFLEDDNYKYIMKRLLEASMEESFNSVVITEKGPGYPIIYVNPAFCELTGYGPHELIGKSPSILQGPNTDQKVLQRLNQNIADGELFHGQAINYRRDGSEFMMEWKIAPIRNEKDEITHYLAIQREVSS